MATQEGWLIDASHRLSQLASQATERERVRLERHSAELHSLAERYCERGQMRLEMMREQLATLTERMIERQAAMLRMASEVVEARSPERILRLGFAVVRADGRAITSAEGLSGREVDIELAKGSVRAEIK